MRPSSVLCRRAIAYLKAAAARDDPRQSVVLDHDSSPVLRELGGGLLVSYVVDQGSHFELINNAQLAAAGLTTDELHEIAVDNLAEAAHAQGVRVHAYDEIFAVIAGGNFEASLLLVDDMWEHGFRQFVTGEYAVAIPARDVLAFGDADSARGRAQLRAVIGRLESTSDHRLVDHVLFRSATGWTALSD